jgi:hypothetical protein
MLSSLATAVGCTNSGSDGPTIVEGDGVRLLVAAKSPAVLHHARITGTVALSKGNCFGIETGGRKILVVWPHGTKITNDGGVDVPGADSLKIGDSIVAGGGSSSHLASATTCPPSRQSALLIKCS